MFVIAIFAFLRFLVIVFNGKFVGQILLPPLLVLDPLHPPFSFELAHGSAGGARALVLSNPVLSDGLSQAFLAIFLDVDLLLLFSLAIAFFDLLQQPLVIGPQGFYDRLEALLTVSSDLLLVGQVELAQVLLWFGVGHSLRVSKAMKLNKFQPEILHLIIMEKGKSDGQRTVGRIERGGSACLKLKRRDGPILSHFGQRNE